MVKSTQCPFLYYHNYLTIGIAHDNQVEINTGVGYVPDFSDSVLIHRSEIEEINSQIRVNRNIVLCTYFPLLNDLYSIDARRGQA